MIIQREFYRKPFILLFVSFAVGTLSTYFVDGIHLYFLFVVLFSIFFTSYFLLKKDWIWLIAVFCAFTLLGALNMEEHVEKNEPDFYEKSYLPGDKLMVRLDETSAPGESGWSKCIGTILQVNHFGKWTPHHVPVLFFVESLRKPADNQLLLSDCELQKITNSGNPGEFDAEHFWHGKGIQLMAFAADEEQVKLAVQKVSVLKRTLTFFREKLKNALSKELDGQERAVALALVLGDRSMLDAETNSSFSNAGAMHVLSVSGMHVGIIMQFLIAFFGYFPTVFTKRSATISVVVIMWVFAMLTGAAPSVVRAVFMFSVLSVSQLTGRNYNSLNTLFFTALILVLINPYVLFDLGFQLTYLAMLGIFLFYRKIEVLFYFSSTIVRKIWQGTAVGIAAQLMTAPISLYYFHQFPNYFAVSNLMVMLTSSIILGGGIFLLIVSYIPVIGKFSGIILGFVLWITIWFIDWTAKLPGSVAYGFSISFYLVVLLTLLFIFLLFQYREKVVYYVVSGVLLMVIGFIEYQRYQNTFHNEICVLNLRQLAVVVKNNNRIDCFYKAKPEQMNKIERAMHDYMVSNPGQVFYHSLNQYNWKLKVGNQRLEIKLERTECSIQFNNQQLNVLLSGNNLTENLHPAITMSWLDIPGMYSLKNGAYRIRFKH